MEALRSSTEVRESPRGARLPGRAVRRLGGLQWAAVLVIECGCGDPGSGSEDRLQIEAPGRLDDASRSPAAVLDLAASAANRLGRFRPRIWVEEPFPGWRSLPMLRVESPWNPAQFFLIEVPEYVWGAVPGKHARLPLFYGRSMAFAFRQPGPEEPCYPLIAMSAWQQLDDGGLALDAALAGGHVVRFRVHPHDGAVEIVVGFSNGGGDSITGFTVQICMHPEKESSFCGRDPGTTRLLLDGELAAWDACGQSLDWLERFRHPGTDEFSHACTFIAQTSEDAPRSSAPRCMVLEERIDLPAIAKLHADRSAAVIAYSPQGRHVMYNAFTPCFHADPELSEIRPGETGWTRTYYLFLEGDLTAAFRDLARIHAGPRAATEAGG